MMADGQVVILDHEMTVRKGRCCGADRSHYTGLGLPTFGTRLHDRDAFLVQVFADWGFC